MNNNYKSEILHMIHDEAIANYEVGAITREELEEYDRACLVSEPPAIPTMHDGDLQSMIPMKRLV